MSRGEGPAVPPPRFVPSTGRRRGEDTRSYDINLFLARKMSYSSATSRSGSSHVENECLSVLPDIFEINIYEVKPATWVVHPRAAVATFVNESMLTNWASFLIDMASAPVFHPYTCNL